VFSRISGRENSGGASSHAPPPLAARGFTRRHRKTKQQGVSGSTSSSQSPYAGGDLQSNRTQHRQLILIFLSFSDLFRSSPFSNLLHFCFLPSSGGRSGDCVSVAVGVAVLCGQPGEAAMERGWLSDLHSSWQI
jgi:hypothetical protein